MQQGCDEKVSLITCVQRVHTNKKEKKSAVEKFRTQSVCFRYETGSESAASQHDQTRSKDRMEAERREKSPTEPCSHFHHMLRTLML